MKPPESGPATASGRVSDTPAPVLRLLFCGTPEFALPSLRALSESRHTLAGVVTVPDRPQGRGRQIEPSPVKVAAGERRLPLWQPEHLDDPDFLAQMESAAPDLIVVVAFRILPEEFFGLARLGAMNLHASLLPEYRGAAPIARALMDGRERTGVTTFLIDRKVDTGGILLQTAETIHAQDNAGTLSTRLAEIGAGLIVKTVNGLASGTLSPQPQESALATRAPKLTAADRPIRWDQPALDSHNRVRALAPRPGAISRKNKKILKVLETTYDPLPVSARPGAVTEPHAPVGIGVATGLGTLYLRTLQPEGKSVMTALAFQRGHRMEAGEYFE